MASGLATRYRRSEGNFQFSIFNFQFALLFLLLAGCGSGRPETVDVSGRITLGGGDWPKPGQLYFTLVKPAEGFTRRPGKATFDVDGDFKAFTWKPGDGLMPGTYRVHVACWETPPTIEGGGRSHVPEPYGAAATSPLELSLQPGQGAVTLDWNVPKP